MPMTWGRRGAQVSEEIMMFARTCLQLPPIVSKNTRISAPGRIGEQSFTCFWKRCALGSRECCTYVGHLGPLTATLRAIRDTLPGVAENKLDTICPTIEGPTCSEKLSVSQL